jgi:hypothetical protein
MFCGYKIGCSFAAPDSILDIQVFLYREIFLYWRGDIPMMRRN